MFRYNIPTFFLALKKTVCIFDICFFFPSKKIKGLEIMNDDPSEVDVVYGRVHCEPLQSMAEYIVNQFIDTGFMPRQFDRIKLHVTLMNTKFRLKDADEEESIPESSKYFQFHEKNRF